MPPSPHRFSAAGGAGKSNAAAAGFVKGQQQIHSADLQWLVHGYELGGRLAPRNSSNLCCSSYPPMRFIVRPASLR